MKSQRELCDVTGFHVYVPSPEHTMHTKMSVLYTSTKEQTYETLENYVMTQYCTRIFLHQDIVQCHYKHALESLMVE